jgi:cardiolipin synthase
MLPVRVLDNEWSRFDLRNHRKIVVVDGAVGFTGSQNLINAHYNKAKTIKKGYSYDELMVRVSGPIVLELEAIFAADWYSETEVVLTREDFAELRTEPEVTGAVTAQVLPSGPGQELESNWLLFTALIYHATTKLVIATPYFVPNTVLRTALTTAARRGVDVQLIVSGAADQFLVSRAQRANYEELLDAGVTIYLYKPPAILHAKTMSVDEHIAVLGSSNMDIRSFELNLEISLVVYDRQVVAALRELEQCYIQRSELLSREEWARRPFGQKLMQNITRLASELV